MTDHRENPFLAWVPGVYNGQDDRGRGTAELSWLVAQDAHF